MSRQFDQTRERWWWLHDSSVVLQLWASKPELSGWHKECAAGRMLYLMLTTKGPQGLSWPSRTAEAQKHPGHRESFPWP